MLFSYTVSWWSLTHVFTINIPPKSMIKWGKSSLHVLHFVYNSPSSTCACRIICMQKIIAKMGQNGVKYKHREQVDVAVGPGTHMPRRPAPPWPLPRHRSVGAAPEAFSCVDLSRFAPMDEMELSWNHRPTIIDLGGSNRPWNRLTGQNLARVSFTTAFGSQPAP